MKNEWRKLAGLLGVSSAHAEDTYTQLTAAYATVGRHYHTLRHIERVLETLQSFQSRAVDFYALQLAAWFHDTVYDPHATDNEERSADLAASILSDLRVSSETIGEVRRLILLTKTHDPTEDDSDGQLLVDADLSILGASASEYRQYADAIRQEYAWVSEEAYRSGRAAVLEKFLRRPCIFHTDEIAVSLEASARHNLIGECRALGARKN